MDWRSIIYTTGQRGNTLYRVLKNFVSIAVCLACIVPSPTEATVVELQTPEHVDAGSAFLVTALTDVTDESLTFSWCGKSYHVLLESFVPENFGEKHDAALGWRVAQILLPVPLEEKQGVLTVQASAGSGQNVIKDIRQIVVQRTQRPTQHLRVDRGYVTPPADVLSRIAKERALVLTTLEGYTQKRSWGIPFFRPVPGKISSRFGLKRIFNGEPRGRHKGLDLRAAHGVPIQALADGRVVLSRALYYAGNAVYVDHGLGVFSAYMHMSSTAVQTGQWVRRGDVLGHVGATGRVTGPHLHLSLYVQGCAVDPEPLLEDAPEK